MRIRYSLSLAVLAAAGMAGAAGAKGLTGTTQTSEDQALWFEASFDEQGAVKSLKPVDEAAQPAALWAELQKRLAKARIPAPQLNGQPASLQTGLRLELSYSKPEGAAEAQMRIASLKPGPLPVQLNWLSYPADIRKTGDWRGEISVSCEVTVKGVCGEIQLDAPAGMPESVRRWARSSAQEWRFQPQTLNGEPISGEFAMKVQLQTSDERPPEFRDPAGRMPKRNP